MTDTDSYKRQAAARALDFVEDGMRVGLGTGSTAAHFVRLLAERVAAGLSIRTVATSEATASLARELGIAVGDFDEMPTLDLTVDGADEIDPELRLIKGGGGAQLREKIVAAASAQMIVIADAGKVVKRLGRFPLPIEVVPFGIKATLRRLSEMFADHGLGEKKLILRRKRDGILFVTDSGNHILDAHLEEIDDPEPLGPAINDVPGVVEHGLFLGIASMAVVAGDEGVTILEPQGGRA
jgi:ribose 5-phosphate isomerase A